MLPENLTIPRRFNGPPQSANGGWAAGLLAGTLLHSQVVANAPRSSPPVIASIQPFRAHAGIAVSLRAPPPLDTALQVLALEGGGVSLQQGEQILAQAQFESFVLDVPEPPTMSMARQASRNGFELAKTRASWPYSKCFGCGVARDDGLCITPSPLSGLGDGSLIAAAWTPPVWLAQGDGQVSIEAVWAALDCPAGIAWSYQLSDGAPMVTARIALSIDELPEVGVPCMVLGWPISRDGRKLHAGTALFSQEGQVLARSRQLWLVPRE